MLEKFKFGFFVLLLVIWGSAQWAKADDEISCATDDDCQRQKLDMHYKEFEKNERKAKRAKKARGYKPCALDDDCQRSKLDAVDREQGIPVQED